MPELTRASTRHRRMNCEKVSSSFVLLTPLAAAGRSVLSLSGSRRSGIASNSHDELSGPGAWTTCFGLHRTRGPRACGGGAGSGGCAGGRRPHPSVFAPSLWMSTLPLKYAPSSMATRCVPMSPVTTADLVSSARSLARIFPSSLP